MMSIEHGPVNQKTISELADYLKKLIPVNIPKNYDLKPIFEKTASPEEIRRGVVAYRDFLYLLFERLISDGHLFFKLKKKPKNVNDYPFLYRLTDLLSDIGYHSKFAKDSDSLLMTQIPSYSTSIDKNGKKRKSKNPVSKLKVFLQFLSLCGFEFSGIDTKAKKVKISDGETLKISYPKNPLLLTGLKALSYADIELRKKRYKNDNKHDNLLRCDYGLLKKQTSDINNALTDFLDPLPRKVKEFAFALHKHHLDQGMTCTAKRSTFESHFYYSYLNKQRKDITAKKKFQLRTWEFTLCTKFGYCLVVRSQKTEKYKGVIEKFPLILQEKIKKGYGCDRKLRNEPCQGGCQGIRIPLDPTILKIKKQINLWLDKEISYKIGK